MGRGPQALFQNGKPGDCVGHIQAGGTQSVEAKIVTLNDVF